MENTLMSPLKPLAMPAYMLLLENKDITNTIARRLISLTLNDNRGEAADDLTIVLDDSDGQIQLPRPGAVITAHIGYQGEGLIPVGEYKIDQVKHEGAPDKVTVIGRSTNFSDSFNTLRETSWHDTTLGAIVSSIAARNKVEAKVAPALQNIKVAHIDQTQESDASFLYRLAVRNGAAVAFKWGKVMLVKPGSGLKPDGKPFSQVTIARRDGDQHSYEVAERINYSGVIARWLDTKVPQKQMQQIKLLRKTTPPATAGATHPESQAAPEQKPASQAAQGENVYTLSTIFQSEEEAKRAAEAFLKQTQSNAAKFSITLALGRADITPETPVRVSGFKQVIDDTTWVISKVAHTMDNKGFITKLDLEIKIEEGQYDAIQN